MTALREIYVCELCGVTACVIEAGPGQLVCCGQEMKQQKENTVEASTEKHIPVLQVSGTTATVNVGAVAHPMEEKHHINWIEIQQGSVVQWASLKPGDAPQAVFAVAAGSPITVRAYCNLHGLWKG